MKNIPLAAFISATIASLAFAAPAFAAYNDVTFVANVSNLLVNGVSLTIVDQNNTIESAQVTNAGTLVISAPAGSSFEVLAPGLNVLSTNLNVNTTPGLSVVCAPTQSRITYTSLATTSVTITPSTTQYCPVGSGGGPLKPATTAPASSGGGGGVPTPAAPAPKPVAPAAPAAPAATGKSAAAPTAATGKGAASTGKTGASTAAGKGTAPAASAKSTGAPASASSKAGTGSATTGGTSAPTAPVASPASGKATGTSAPTSAVASFHAAGTTGTGAASLQQYLNTHGFTVAKTGPGSPGNETSSVGPATKAAISALQKAAGLPVTGTLGPQTQAYIQAHP